MIKSRLRENLVYHDYMHDSFDWMVVTITESIFLSFLLDGCAHTSDLVIYTLLWMAAPIPHIHVSKISVIRVLAGLPTTIFGLGMFS